MLILKEENIKFWNMMEDIYFKIQNKIWEKIRTTR